MTKQIVSTPNSNIDFIRLKPYDFSDEKINQKKSFQKDSIKTQK